MPLPARRGPRSSGTRARLCRRDAAGRGRGGPHAGRAARGIERGGTAFAPADPQSRTDRERFGEILEGLLFHEELGLVAVTRAGPDPADGEGPVRAVAEGMPLAGVGRG
jgi:hypothetical protein